MEIFTQVMEAVRTFQDMPAKQRRLFGLALALAAVANVMLLVGASIRWLTS